MQGIYGGIRTIDLPVRIFYQGDPDIQDVITVSETPGTVQAPVPNRARATLGTARGAQTSPPARSTPPARARTPRPQPQPPQ